MAYCKNKTNAGRASGEMVTYINSNYHSKKIIINTNLGNLEIVAGNVLIKNTKTICNIFFVSF